ncbi:uncharacterized protein LOC111692085 [Anoplophora glabripennis]|uniref:uncharacterized protein LOC111692085 n=1 Tax=Anoplophora glabripennis TaxID=217634 RepID=UPI000C7930CC|nr:uncharacterized protein LOC111692085 [Anoplophora glabripennis]
MENLNLMLWNDIINEDVEEAVAELAIRRDVLPQTNAFQVSVSDRKFLQLFRVDKHLCHDIINMVNPFLEPLLYPYKPRYLLLSGFMLQAVIRNLLARTVLSPLAKLQLVEVNDVKNALNQPEILNNFSAISLVEQTGNAVPRFCSLPDTPRYVRGFKNSVFFCRGAQMRERSSGAPRDSSLLLLSRIDVRIF